MKQEISAGGIVLNNNKIVIVFQNKTNSWALPKGHVNKDESLLQTAKRDL